MVVGNRVLGPIAVKSGGLPILVWIFHKHAGQGLRPGNQLDVSESSVFCFTLKFSVWVVLQATKRNPAVLVDSLI